MPGARAAAHSRTRIDTWRARSLPPPTTSVPRLLAYAGSAPTRPITITVPAMIARAARRPRRRRRTAIRAASGHQRREPTEPSTTISPPVMPREAPGTRRADAIAGVAANAKDPPRHSDAHIIADARRARRPAAGHAGGESRSRVAVDHESLRQPCRCRCQCTPNVADRRARRRASALHVEVVARATLRGQPRPAARRSRPQLNDAKAVRHDALGLDRFLERRAQRERHVFAHDGAPASAARAHDLAQRKVVRTELAAIVAGA